jgi:hypothetical protein
MPVLTIDRRTFFVGTAGLALGGCFEGSCYDSNPQQKKFLADLAALAKPAMASNNPLAIEDAAKRSVALAEAVGSFTDWCGTLKAIDGKADTVAITIEVGPQVSLYAFNDWTLATAGALAKLFDTRSREAPPPGLSDQAVTALKAFRLGQHVQLSGRMGAIAGSGLFDLSRLLGKSDSDNRQFLQSPRFVARIESLAASTKK